MFGLLCAVSATVDASGRYIFVDVLEVPRMRLGRRYATWAPLGYLRLSHEKASFESGF